MDHGDLDFQAVYAAKGLDVNKRRATEKTYAIWEAWGVTLRLVLVYILAGIRPALKRRFWA